MVLCNKGDGGQYPTQREKHIKRTGSWREFHVPGTQPKSVKEECQERQTSWQRVDFIDLCRPGLDLGSHLKGNMNALKVLFQRLAGPEIHLQRSPALWRMDQVETKLILRAISSIFNCLKEDRVVA